MAFSRSHAQNDFVQSLAKSVRKRARVGALALYYSVTRGALALYCYITRGALALYYSITRGALALYYSITARQRAVKQAQ